MLSKGQRSWGRRDSLTLPRYVPSSLLFTYSFFMLKANENLVLQAMVRMKALQDRDIAKEGVITRLHKRIKNMTDG